MQVQGPLDQILTSPSRTCGSAQWIRPVVQRLTTRRDTTSIRLLDLPEILSSPWTPSPPGPQNPSSCMIPPRTSCSHPSAPGSPSWILSEMDAGPCPLDLSPDSSRNPDFTLVPQPPGPQDLYTSWVPTPDVLHSLWTRPLDLISAGILTSPCPKTPKPLKAHKSRIPPLRLAQDQTPWTCPTLQHCSGSDSWICPHGSSEDPGVTLYLLGPTTRDMQDWTRPLDLTPPSP